MHRLTARFTGCRIFISLLKYCSVSLEAENTAEHSGCAGKHFLKRTILQNKIHNCIYQTLKHQTFSVNYFSDQNWGLNLQLSVDWSVWWRGLIFFLLFFLSGSCAAVWSVSDAVSLLPSAALYLWQLTVWLLLDVSHTNTIKPASTAATTSCYTFHNKTLPNSLMWMLTLNQHAFVLFWRQNHYFRCFDAALLTLKVAARVSGLIT